MDNYKQFIDEIVTELNNNNQSAKGKAYAKCGVYPKNLREWGGVKNYRSQSTESKPHFEIEIEPRILQDWLKKAGQEQRAGVLVDNIEKRFRLTSKISTSNMHLYSVNG